MSIVTNILFEEYNGFRASSNDPTVGSSSLKRQDSFCGKWFVWQDEVVNECWLERIDTVYKRMVNELGFQDASIELELYLKDKV